MRTDTIPVEERCERCSALMTKGAMSCFSPELICPDCLAEEQRRIALLELRGIDPATLAGAGSLPAAEDPGDARPPLPA